MKNNLAAIAGACFLFACNNTTDTSHTNSPVSSDSPAVNQATPVITTSPAGVAATDSAGTFSGPGSAVSSAVPSQAAPTAAGMNPPHGEPGHRCDISVGAPLNSKPTVPQAGTAATPQQSAPTFTPAPVTPGSTAATATTAAPATTTAPGMNPPHGQPGHDCAIAVGAPLKK